MDLKGSLVDTCLKIFPSDTLQKFLEDVAGDDIPSNILKFTKHKDRKPTKNETVTGKSVPIQLNNKDFENLNRIKNIVKKVKSEKPPAEEPGNLSDTKSNDKCEDESSKELSEETSEDITEKDVPVAREGPYLLTSDIDWLFVYLQNKRTNGDKDTPYLNVLLEGSYIETPQNLVLKRNPLLEARCVKLRAQQEAREYRQMTKSVDNVRMRFPEDSISYQLKQLNRQLIAIGQFIISIFAGFLFGFKGVEWTIGPDSLDFGFRLLLGVMCALIIALAEIYFLAKKLNEELSVPETTQLGGPPKFVDEKTYNSETKKVSTKPHQD